MGSWANNVHVRHNDPKTVADAVQSLLLASGYEADTDLSFKNEDLPAEDHDGPIDAASRNRRVIVCKPIDEWVSILDSEGLMGTSANSYRQGFRRIACSFMSTTATPGASTCGAAERSVDHYDSCGEAECAR